MWFTGNKTRIILFAVGFLIFAQRALPESDSDGYRYSVSDRDPMASLIDSNGGILIAKKAGLGGLVLKGIIYSPAMPLAIINDEVLSEGDMVAGYVIIEIKEKEVTLEKDNKGFTLKLEE
jgi:hypothetical protein